MIFIIILVNMYLGQFLKLQKIILFGQIQIMLYLIIAQIYILLLLKY